MQPGGPDEDSDDADGGTRDSWGTTCSVDDAVCIPSQGDGSRICGNCDELGCRVGSFTALPCTGGRRAISPCCKEIQMDKQSCENHIVTLKKVRDACDSRLDAGVLTELDEVITALQKHRDRRLPDLDAVMLPIRILQIVAAVVSAWTRFDSWK